MLVTRKGRTRSIVLIRNIHKEISHIRENLGRYFVINKYNSLQYFATRRKFRRKTHVTRLKRRIMRICNANRNARRQTIRIRHGMRLVLIKFRRPIAMQLTRHTAARRLPSSCSLIARHSSHDPRHSSPVGHIWQWPTSLATWVTWRSLCVRRSVRRSGNL